jgi:predicted nucleic acid-binding protein
MRTKVLVDTNLWLYAYDKSSIHHPSAVSFLENSESCEYVICTKNIAEFWAVSSKNNQPIDTVIIFLSAVRANSSLLFPNPESLLIFDELLIKYKPRGNKVYDLEIVSIALANQVTKIATKNINDFAYISEVEIVPV